MKKVLHWLDENLEEFLLVVFLIAMTLIMGIQVLSRYVLGQSLSWSEEITRYLFIWSGFLSVSYCSKKCLSIKIEQFVAIFPRRGKALFKVVNHTFELIFFLYMIPFAASTAFPHHAAAHRLQQHTIDAQPVYASIQNAIDADIYASYTKNLADAE